MNEAHLADAVRYVELNPVRAKLVSRGIDWKWSSGHAHLTGADDVLARVKPMLELFPDWAGYLAEHGQDDAERIRIHTRTGRPLGDSTFIQAAESMTGRIWTPKKLGRKPSPPL